MRRHRRNPGDNLPIILGGMALSLVAIVGLLAWGKSRPAPSLPSSSPDERPPLDNVVLFPDLKVGDAVVVDAAAAGIQGASTPLIVCTVDIVMTDRTLVSVRAQASSFAGTIPRSAIVRVLPPPPPGVFT